MHTLADTDIRALARLGAIARLKEIDEEAAAIRKAFPALKTSEVAGPAGAPATAPKKRQRRNVSPEVRKAAADRMRAYWAKKRGEASASAEGSQPATASPAASPARRKTVAPKRSTSRKKR